MKVNKMSICTERLERIPRKEQSRVFCFAWWVIVSEVKNKIVKIEQCRNSFTHTSQGLSTHLTPWYVISNKQARLVSPWYLLPESKTIVCELLLNRQAHRPWWYREVNHFFFSLPISSVYYPIQMLHLNQDAPYAALDPCSAHKSFICSLKLWVRRVIKSTTVRDCTYKLLGENSTDRAYSSPSWRKNASAAAGEHISTKKAPKEGSEWYCRIIRLLE